MAECMGDLPSGWWHDPRILQHEYLVHGSIRQISYAHPDGPGERWLKEIWHRMGLPPLKRGGPRAKVQTTHDDNWLLTALQQRKEVGTVEELADQCDVSPRRVRDATLRLRATGHNIAITETEAVVVEKVPPKRENLHKTLFDGDLLRRGVVSDTHLGSNQCAVNELRLAYEMFADAGIEEVWHTGDIGTGLNVYRGQHAETMVHTLDEQIDYICDEYPQHDGIVTRVISGNHDFGGDASAVGLDVAAAVAARRPDIEWLGAYEAWLELRPDTNKWVHLLHGAGGMSYSWSYKAQKMVDNYPSGRKPSVLIPGHWHVRGNIRQREVEVLWPGCFEWQSAYMARLGLHGTVGFHIIEMVVADDGSVVRWRPEWFPFYAGRHTVRKRRAKQEPVAA